MFIHSRSHASFLFLVSHITLFDSSQTNSAMEALPKAERKTIFKRGFFRFWILLPLLALIFLREYTSIISLSSYTTAFKNNRMQSKGTDASPLVSNSTLVTAVQNNITKSEGTDASPLDSNSTLVVIIGNLRCGELVWQYLIDNVLDVNSADLALMIGDTLPKYRNSSVFERAEYMWTFPEYEEWGDAIDLMEAKEQERIYGAAFKNASVNASHRVEPLPSWRKTILPLVHEESGVFAGVKGFTSGSGVVQFMARYFLQERIRELGLLERYDRFVIVRSDSYYKCALNLTELDPVCLGTHRLRLGRSM